MPARLADSRRTDSRTVRRAIRRKEQRTDATQDLEQIKLDMIAELSAAGVTTLHKVDPNTGQRIVLCSQRKGSPVDEARIADVLDLLTPEIADRLFPPVTRRTWDWPAIQDFVNREYPKGSKQAIARNRIVDTIRQDSNYTLRVYDAQKIFCVECAKVLVAPKNGIHLCDDHRKWFKMSALGMALNAANPVVTLKDFNDTRKRSVRAAWLKSDAIEAWEANNSREGRALIREARKAAR